MLIFIFILISLIYLGGIGYLAWHWQRIKAPKNKNNLPGHEIMLSVVVVMRNEEGKIRELLGDLSRQDYKKNCFEVLVVDDHSEDGSCREVLDRAASLPYKLRLLRLGLQTGKKAGLALGVREAAGAVVVVTDGDCRVQAPWLSRIAEMWRKKDPVFVSGPVTLNGEEGLFEKLQTIEFASLVGAGAAMLQAGQPGMCNAANMAFSKGVFQQVQEAREDSHIPSGDDEFLLQAISKLYPDRMYFLKHREAVVHTRGQQSWADFYQQRKRWAGKWRLHRKPSILITAIAVFLLQAGWLISSALMMCYYPLFYFFAGVLLKFGAEFLFLRSVLRSMGKKMLLIPFLLLQLLYPFYVLFFGLAVNFGRFTWKGRTYNYSKL